MSTDNHKVNVGSAPLEGGLGVDETESLTLSPENRRSGEETTVTEAPTVPQQMDPAKLAKFLKEHSIPDGFWTDPDSESLANLGPAGT